jgi:hypothetical protein
MKEIQNDIERWREKTKERKKRKQRENRSDRKKEETKR